MEGYLKKHETQSAYTTWTGSQGYVVPNVSLIAETDGVIYNPIPGAQGTQGTQGTEPGE